MSSDPLALLAALLGAQQEREPSEAPCTTPHASFLERLRAAQARAVGGGVGAGPVTKGPPLAVIGVRG